MLILRLPAQPRLDYRPVGRGRCNNRAKEMPETSFAKPGTPLRLLFACLMPPTLASVMVQPGQQPAGSFFMYSAALGTAAGLGLSVIPEAKVEGARAAQFSTPRMKRAVSAFSYGAAILGASAGLGVAYVAAPSHTAFTAVWFLFSMSYLQVSRIVERR